MSLIEWVKHWFKPYRIQILTLNKTYCLSFFRGKAAFIGVPPECIRGLDIKTIWYDETGR